MKPILPDREAAEKNGWKYQVQWVEDGKPCHVRCKSAKEAGAWADKLQRQELNPFIIDLSEALQLH